MVLLLDTMNLPRRQQMGGAFNFCITDENDNAFVLQYINSTGGTDTISDGIVNSYQDPVDSIPGSSKEWGKLGWYYWLPRTR